jgi:hypothetical protein
MSRSPRAPARARGLIGGPLLILLLSAGCSTGKGGDPAATEVEATAPVAFELEATGSAPPTSDGEDNDCDGEIDEADERELRPLWRRDADHDGVQSGTPEAACTRPPFSEPLGSLDDPLDCDDTDPTVRPGQPEDCLRPGDDDCSGAQDCADPACASLPCVEDCDDPADNDADGLDDCLDPDCPAGLCPEDCAAGMDRDRDGRIGCVDPECWGPACAEDCAASGDEDLDGLANCEDADCAARCVEDCDNRDDDDDDGAEDCADLDCAYHPACPPVALIFPEGGADLVVNSLRDTRTLSYSWGRYEATLQLHSVRVERPTSAGAAVCSLTLPTLSVFSRHEVRSDSMTVFRTWRSAHLVLPLSAPVGSPGCPAPTTAELAAAELRVGGLPDLSSWGITRPLIPNDIDVILSSEAFGRRWAASGLDIGPHRAWGRSEWGRSTARITRGSQTAVIDSLVPAEPR